MAAFTRQGTACQALFLLCAIVLSFVTVSDASLRKIEAPCTACKAVAVSVCPNALERTLRAVCSAGQGAVPAGSS